MAISFRLSLSILSRNGSFTLAFPIMIFLRRPEIIKAVSGGAFLYPVNIMTITKMMTTPAMIYGNCIIPSPPFS